MCGARYWNDKDVLKKLGEAMGIAVGAEQNVAAEPEPEEAEEGEDEEESIVHQTASLGDVEVVFFSTSTLVFLTLWLLYSLIRIIALV